MTAETPTIVLVHGAWADATGFDAEIRALQGRAYTAIGFGNPLRDLAGDAVGPTGVEHTAVLVSARYRGPSDPPAAPAVHG